MKKELGLGLSAFLTFGMLVGCSGKDAGNNDLVQGKNIVENSEESVSTSKETADDHTLEDSPDNPDATSDSMKMYEEFMAGDRTVHVDGVYGFPDGNLTLQELIDGHASLASADGMPDAISEGNYAYIDCGNDGEPELALSLSYFIGDGYFAPAIQYLVIRPVSDELYLITNQEEYYRYGVNMNKYGYFKSWGSGGAALGYSGESFVSADGEYFKLFDCDTYYGLSVPVISPDALPDSLSDILVPDDFGYSDDYYYMDSYAFGETISYEDYKEEDWDVYYSDYATSRSYSFYDMMNEEPVMPDDEYVALCRENGIRIYSGDEIDEMLQARYDAYGVTEEMRSDEEPDWIPFEVMDKLSKYAQIKLFVDNSELWLLDDSSIADGSLVEYAVTDLNRNGRYELIRSEKIYFNPDNTSFCRNRFFEVNEDYTGIEKMDYETEYIWDDGGGELGGWEHDLLGTAEKGYFDCYWYGSEDQEKTDYYYVIPTLYTTEESADYGERKMVLIVKPDGSIPYYEGDLGWKFYNASNDSFRYTDEGGIECSEEMYQTGIEETVFDPKSGWNKDVAYISYVELDPYDMDSVKEELFRSADSWWFYADEYTSEAP